MIVSVSGLRCITGKESLSTFFRVSYGFASKYCKEEILIGTDTRNTSQAILRVVVGATLFANKKPVILGTVSTPAICRESRIKKKPAIMITASHNEPEWNGLKLILGGKSVEERILKSSLNPSDRGSLQVYNHVAYSSYRYNEDFLKRYKGNFSGMKVALDLGGGSAIFHASKILSSLGCSIIQVNDKAGFFPRKIDPIEDNLELLCYTVKENNCDAGFAFDSDGDRLVMIDNRGRKLSGDRMLSAAIFHAMKHKNAKRVVASLDTTLAVRDIVAAHKGRLYWSKVGEANVVKRIKQVKADIGGEGSSGGLIDPSFNFCRDSLVAIYHILSCIKEIGERAFEIGSDYFQKRTKVSSNDINLNELASKFQKKYTVETMDGLKIWIDENTWVLIRKSNTENVVRISAESKSRKKTLLLARKFEKIVKGMTRKSE
jgi:phosphomannomutase